MRSLFCVNSRGGTGAREIHPSLDEMNKVRSKKSKEFSGRNRKFKRFFRPKTGDLQKKRSSLKLQGIFRPKSQIQAVFPAEIANSSGFSGRKQVISKKKGLHSKNVTKSGVSPQKTLIWTSICAPEAPSLLISSGHSPRLGGHNFRLRGHKQSVGGARSRYAPPWRRVWPQIFLFKTVTALPHLRHFCP